MIYISDHKDKGTAEVNILEIDTHTKRKTNTLLYEDSENEDYNIQPRYMPLLPYM